MDAVVICGAQRSISSNTFNGSPTTPRTVKKLIASAASRTRKSRLKAGRAWSGNADRPAPGAEQLPHAARQKNQRQRDTQAPRAAERFVEVDVEQRDDEQAETDADRGDRDDVWEWIWKS